MMHGREKSAPAIVAGKPANKAEGPSAARPAEEKHAAESGERRAGTKGNADQQSTYRTQSRASVSQALERIRQVASDRPAVTDLRWEPYAGKPHVRICAGGGEQSPSLPRPTCAMHKVVSYLRYCGRAGRTSDAAEFLPMSSPA